MFSAQWCEVTWMSDRGEKRKCNFSCLLSFFSFSFWLVNLKSYTFRIHPSIILKDFHRRLRLKTIQKCDFILCFRQELRQSVHGFVQNFVSQGLKGEVPGALEPWNFCLGARSPIILLTGTLILFWLWSPEPKEILRGARSSAFWNLIIRVPRLHWFFLLLFTRKMAKPFPNIVLD